MSYHQGSRLDDLADVVLQNIHDRETLIERLEKVHTKDAHGRGIRVQKLLYGIHNASLGVVEAIAAWNLDKQDAWLRKKNIETHSSPTNKLSSLSTGLDSSAAPCPFNVFLWNTCRARIFNTFLKNRHKVFDFHFQTKSSVTKFSI